MPRYIDALEIRYTYRPVGGDIAYKDEIETLPTADVAPVIHARWIEDGCLIRCSNCGERKLFPHWVSCPACGAKMGEEENER